MKKFLVGFVLGVGAGVAGYWFVTLPTSQTRIDKAQEQVTQSAEQLKVSIQKTLEDIKPDDIKQELARTGTVIREKAKQAGQAIADATADARITAAIKAKLAGISTSSALHIKVDTTGGLVTLSGTAKTHEEVAQAIKIALETEGVHKVISTIQLPTTP